MCFKARTEPVEMKILRLLNNRMTLADKDLLRYHKRAKGYEGEVMFDSLTEKLQCQSFILNDLFIETGGAKFQIDSLMISQEPIYVFEVKNYEGDYFYENGRFYTMANKEINNPLQQLERSESLLRQLLQNLGYRIPIEAYVVFINPSFHLFQSPLNKPIIYPNQLPKFMNKLNSSPSILNKRHKSLADKLVSVHQIETNINKLPTYDYGSLRKGSTCAVCHSFEVTIVDKHLVCKVCGHQEMIDTAILRAVEEIMLLFPGRKITTIGVHEWCQVVDSRKRIRRVLMQNLSYSGKTKGLFYE